MQWTAKNGGFVIMSHNNVPDFEANLLKTTLNDVEIEPILQKIDNEWLNGLAGNNAGADMRAQGVWRQGQNAFFDNRLTNTNAGSQKHLSVNAVLEKHEKVKKKELIIVDYECGKWNFPPIGYFYDRWWRPWYFHIPQAFCSENSK